MREMHKGILSKTTISRPKDEMAKPYGYYWPTITVNCVAYARGYEACQMHGPLQRVPTKELHAIVKPWPFMGWAMDLIGKIHPLSSKRHIFIIVVTDYFTKWVEAQPLISVTQVDVIRFIKTQIIYWFGVPETITTNHDTLFIGEKFKTFTQQFGFRLVHSSSYYAQANG